MGEKKEWRVTTPETRPQNDRGHACVDMTARDGRMAWAWPRKNLQEVSLRLRPWGGGRKIWGRRCEGGHEMTTMDVASVDVAARVGRPRGCRCGQGRQRRRGGGRSCTRDLGIVAEVVASVDVAAWGGDGGCRIEWMRLLDD